MSDLAKRLREHEMRSYEFIGCAVLRVDLREAANRLEEAERERDTLLRRVEAAEKVCEAVAKWDECFGSYPDDVCPHIQDCQDKVIKAIAAWKASREGEAK